MGRGSYMRSGSAAGGFEVGEGGGSQEPRTVLVSCWEQCLVFSQEENKYVGPRKRSIPNSAQKTSEQEMHSP